MSQWVLDAYAVIAFLENEPGAEKVEKILISGKDKEDALLMTAVNYGEVYYSILKERGKKVAEEEIKKIDTLRIEVIPVDASLAKIAGEYKASKKMSYADCFAGALAKQKNGYLITGDKEFKEIEQEIKMIWV